MEVSVDSENRPHVGILTMDHEENQFRGNRNNFIDIIRAGKEVGVHIYVITQKDLKLQNSRIPGYTYDFNREVWNRQMLPLPQVIYNRIPNRADEMLPEVQEIIKDCIKHPKVQLFNPAFFNKWNLFEWLRKSKITKKHIPSTRKLTEKVDFEKLLERHRLLYLKPEKGKAGKGIMRLKRHLTKNFPYRLSIQEKKKSQTFRYNNISRLCNRIKNYAGDEEYIVQQGIVLANYQNRPFDLRVLVQKNRKGLWAISGVGARVAGNLSITTHVPRGGTIDEPQKLLSSTFGSHSAEKIMRSTKKTALSIAKQVEKGSGQTLGEMSMDLGVDTSGHLWFFEANAKPMKFDEPEIRQKSLEQLLNYCLYLSKTKKKTRGQNVAR
jgi:hypothetical protein